MKSSGLGASAASLILLTVSLAVPFTVAGCGGGSDGGGSSNSTHGPMYIQTCSLGCSSGSGGSQVSCALVSVHVNQDIAIYFSQAVDPASLNSSSINVVDVNTGAVPPGLRLIDPGNPNKVIFRPTITFDTLGNATFGFTENHTYRVVLPGQEQGDPGPFVRSTGGKSNQSRMQCEIQTTLGVVDLVPGAPLVDVHVDQAITSTPNPNDTIPNVEAQGAVDVWRNSTIRFAFNDVMNPATLAPNGQATFITIEVDLDGDLQTNDDRIPLAGSYVVQQDTVALTTSMVFTATNGIPSSGDPLLNPALRKVVVTLPPDLRDLAGNQLGNPGDVAFTPEFVPFTAVVLPDQDGENFTDQNNDDTSKTSADWAGGKLTRGYGGGSGRLGQLIIHSGTVTLNTDSQTFPLASQTGHDILDNLQPGIDYFPGHPELGPDTPPALTVTDGIFEFSTISLDPGTHLILTGSNPARLFSRGSVNMQGTIDISGQTPAAHASDLPDGGAGGVGGPNAGDGGKGATRADNTNPALLAIGAINIDQTMIAVDPNGAPGGGVGRLGTLAAGGGGLHRPDTFPFGTTLAQLGTMTVTQADNGCQAMQAASPGGGGAYATDGAAGAAGTFDTVFDHFEAHNTASDGSSNLPTGSEIAPGGSSSMLNIEPPGAPAVIRKLDSENGHLRGGSGGGGGGSDMFISTLNPAGNCSLTNLNMTLTGYKDNSGCGGGGGGGALQLVSGRTVSVSGLIDAAGGNGGGSPDGGALPLDESNNLRTNHAPPGGGGSGGAVRLQGQTIDLIGTTQTRIDVGGGTGGGNFNQSFGGLGGAGLIRLEASLEVLNPASEAPHVGPTDTAIVGPNAENILSVGNWVLPRRRPESFTGAASCWMKPTGNFFQILFRADDPTNPDPSLQYGWNMDVVYDPGTGPVNIKFRGPDPNLPFPMSTAPDFEHFLGNTLNYGVPAGTGSYLAVRFQGVQVVGALQQPCSLSLDPAMGQVLANSLTPWVRHPADLNQFAPKPNAVRFSVVFDTSLVTPNSIPFFIKGVTNLKILAQPD